MKTRAFRTPGAEVFGDDQAFDHAFDFARALEAHLIDPAALEGEEATWIDAPVAMIEEGNEPETIDLDSFDIPIVVDISADDVPARDLDETADPFTGWLRALISAAQSANILVGFEALRSFVSEGRALRHAFPFNAAVALTEANIARLEGDELVATAAFLRVVAEWRRVLAGEGGDFSKCGSRTFDEWSADFLARLLGAPARLDWLKRELRQRGVAAFGLVENAA